MNNKKIISAEMEDVLKRAIIAGLIAGGGVILSYLQKKFPGPAEKEPQIASYKNPYNPNDSGSKPWWTQPPTVTPTVISDATTVSDAAHHRSDTNISTGQIPNAVYPTYATLNDKISIDKA